MMSLKDWRSAMKGLLSMASESGKKSEMYEEEEVYCE